WDLSAPSGLATRSGGGVWSGGGPGGFGPPGPAAQHALVDQADAAPEDGGGAVAVAEDRDLDPVAPAFGAAHDGQVGPASLGVLARGAIEPFVVHGGGPDAARQGDGVEPGGEAHPLRERAGLTRGQGLQRQSIGPGADGVQPA